MSDAFANQDRQEEVIELKLTQPQVRFSGPSTPLQTTKQQVQALPGRDPELAITAQRSSVTRVRPRFRPPMLLVCVIDDGGTTGEWHRIRTDTFLIGRTEGDLQIPHDAGMSSRHFEFRRMFKDGTYRWQVHDVGSTNGTFVRVDKSRLSDGRVLMLGNRRYRFNAGSPPSDAKSSGDTPQPQKGATRAWQTISKADISAELVCLGPDEEGKTFSLVAGEQFIGSKPGMNQVVIDDDHLEPRHSKIFRDERKKWWITDETSTNGTWVSVQLVWLDRMCEILTGEQKFLVRVPE